MVGSCGIILSKHSLNEALPYPPWNSPDPTSFTLVGGSHLCPVDQKTLGCGQPSLQHLGILNYVPPQTSPILGAPLEQFP